MNGNTTKNDDVSIVLGGAAGQGIQTVEQLLVHLFKASGYHLYATKEYMSRVRGGSNSTELRVSSKPVRAFVNRMDFLIPLDKDVLKRLNSRITDDTVIIGDKKKLLGKNGDESLDIIDIPLSDLSKEIGGAIYSNILIVGALTAIFNIDQELLHNQLQASFGAKGEDIVAKNIKAAKIGYGYGQELASTGKVKVNVTKGQKVEKQIVIDGSHAVGLGAIAGGCNFIATYPMSPSTAVLTFLAQQGERFNIIAEQTEDEIAGMNMALGASYAGARAMVTTSGGGYALMVEALSLAGAAELPLVVHLAQRPGPATGLPTRSEQGDLLFALYSGHGEFPRIIYAPGSLLDAFELSQKAFNMAEKYQVPVFLLTDQYFVDSYYNIPKIDVSKYKNENYIIKAEKGYKRYEVTENGVSPRSIPGYGPEVVIADSHEHDEEGHISEDHDNRIRMVDKRLRKQGALLTDAIPPLREGPDNAANLVVCWGSTYQIVQEAINNLGRDDVALLYFRQVYPFPSNTLDYFRNAKNVIVIENNATGQFAQMLHLFPHIEVHQNILKYNGLPFSVEEVEKELNQKLK
ncbi:2-oxoacid:acceptor oxidoreductase subunit alpha [candidate division KSB1 bacterium]|nr:2-oxoacid:acceptor oxidoreductase subunit alpha [candidate division KSB1 bacterium]